MKTVLSPAKVAQMVAEIADHVWRAVLVGSPAPVTRELYERMKQPTIGALVVETSTRTIAPDIERVGFLDRIAEEPILWTGEPWNEAEEGPHPKERVFYVNNLDGVQRRWTNANFIAVPTDVRDLAAAIREAGRE